VEAVELTSSSSVQPQKRIASLAFARTCLATALEDEFILTEAEKEYRLALGLCNEMFRQDESAAGHKGSEGIASIDFIAVAARGGSKLAGLTWRVSWLVAAE
jgi:hypothetical protein